VKVSEEHLPYWAGIKEDPRFELIEGDAIAWMNATDQKFDVIIYDLPDYVKGTEFLYLIPVFELAKSVLSDSNGVVGTHSGGNVCVDDTQMCRYMPTLLNTYKKVFGEARLALTAMPMWQILHGFIIGSKNPQAVAQDGANVNELLKNRLSKPLRFYTGANHDLITKIPDRYGRYLSVVDEVIDVLTLVRNKPNPNPDPNSNGRSSMFRLGGISQSSSLATGRVAPAIRSVASG